MKTAPGFHLVNIVRCDLSWVGPSVEAVQQFKRHQARSPPYRHRLVVRPGFFSWGETDPQSAMNDDPCGKLEHDFYFIKNFSLWLDALTVLRVAYKSMNRQSSG